jgi:hypothetical protein
MRMPHVRQRFRSLRERRRERRGRRAERAHVQDVASQGRGDASTRHWTGGGGGA